MLVVEILDEKFAQPLGSIPTQSQSCRKSSKPASEVRPKRRQPVKPAKPRKPRPPVAAAKPKRPVSSVSQSMSQSAS